MKHSTSLQSGVVARLPMTPSNSFIIIPRHCFNAPAAPTSFQTSAGELGSLNTKRQQVKRRIISCKSIRIVGLCTLLFIAKSSTQCQCRLWYAPGLGGRVVGTVHRHDDDDDSEIMNMNFKTVLPKKSKSISRFFQCLKTISVYIQSSKTSRCRLKYDRYKTGLGVT